MSVLIKHCILLKNDTQVELIRSLTLHADQYWICQKEQIWNSCQRRL